LRRSCSPSTAQRCRKRGGPPRSHSRERAAVELPLAAAGSPRLDAAERDQLIRRAKALSWFSLAYMTLEGTVGITAALRAGSVALLGFGLDSAIEGLASVIVIWRFTGSRRPRSGGPSAWSRRASRPVLRAWRVAVRRSRQQARRR
jgi:hypothetical protein